MTIEAKADLLFEIGTEELPAGYILPALRRYEEVLTRNLNAQRLAFEEIKSYGTPRRLVFIVHGLPLGQSDHTFTVKGPRVEAAFNDKGEPTKTLLGFARAQGVDIGDIIRIETKKGVVVAANKKVKGGKAAPILSKILEKTMATEVFPKSMKWGASPVSFARPVSRILALFDEKRVDVTYGHVKSTTCTLGHRFTGKAEPVEVKGPESFFKALLARDVIVDQEKRKAIIKEGLAEKAGEVGGVVLGDEALTEEVAFLVEYPVVIRGGFDEGFLVLPRQVIINAMRSHQRYFSILDDAGSLMPYFITVANTPAPDMDKIIKGNERVLRARLNDAKFYFDKDKARPLCELTEGLKDVVFQARLGTSYEKVLRFTRLGLYLAERAGFIDESRGKEDSEAFLLEENNPARHKAGEIGEGPYMRLVIGRAAMLSKADLLSGVVGEFPDLQGVMGGIYAREAGEAPEVAAAISEHYRPTAAGGALPKSKAGLIISMADKLDTIAGFFAIGKVPTGAIDPYALRRQAIGIIKMLLESELDLPLDEAAEQAVAVLGPKICAEEERAAVKTSILEFFGERLKAQLRGEGIAFDSIDAVLATRWYNISDAVARIKALESFKDHESCADLVLSFKRVSNILKGFKADGSTPDEAIFSDEAESALFTAARGLAPLLEELARNGDYKGLFEALASIKTDIDRFFDDVMVMVENESIKTNRLLLLSSVRELYFQIADISRLTL
ncbi:MAG: glycine--tRNA ligase subunit beta [Thermodesulfobacteriota bacterium]